MLLNRTLTNVERATAAWGGDLPRWVTLLASAADRSTQRAVADKLCNAGFACSSGTISKLINNKYPASTAEPEQAVLAIFGGDEVLCPVWNETIPLQNCIKLRRRKGPPGGEVYGMYARACPGCINNTDAGTEP